MQNRSVYTQPKRALPPRRRAQPKAKNRLSPILIIGSAAAAGFVMLFGIVAVALAVSLAPDTLPAGVSVAGVPLGDRTVEQATRYLQQHLPNETITATDGSRSWPVTFADLGVSIDTAATIQAARRAAPETDVTPVYTVDLNQAQAGLFTLSEQANIDAVPGNPPQIGRAMDVPVVLDRLRADASGELLDGVLDLNMIEVAPPVEEVSVGPQYDGPTTTHVVERGQELGLIAREYGVSVDDIVSMNGITDPDLLYVGQQLTIPAAGEYMPTAPPAPLTQGKAILVDTSQQRIYAYQDGSLVRTHLVSTGLPATPTVLGDYHIYVKYVADDMSGPGYFLPQVPYTMYFYQGYGIHGTYWHNSFGRQMSHGCVNLPTPEAEWFFNFADVGTLVRVI
jgi:lipoprotein-anchoring transpeptidase ErfK/SrfK